MSYILDALKKLESEKEKKARADGMVNISGALLRDEPRRTPASGVAWKVAVVVVIASLATFGATWFMLHGDKQREHPTSPPVAQTAPVARVTPPVAPSSPAPPVQPSAPTVPAAAPVASSAPAPTPQVIKTKKQAAKSEAVATSSPVDGDDDAPLSPPKKLSQRLKKQKIEAARPVEEQQPAVPVVQAIPSVQTMAAPPADIKVSGIAWQDERNSRRAVVNGFLMREGSVVSGARITEILKDRVRFSTGDKMFEAPLTMTGSAPGAGK